LHVVPAIRCQQDANGLVDDPVDDSAGFKENLAVLPDSQRKKFLGGSLLA